MDEFVAWSGDHGSKVCVARMRANVSNWLSSTTSQQQFPPLSVFRVYPLIPVIPVIPVILYCSGRSAGVQDRRSAGPEVHLATQGSRDHSSACICTGLLSALLLLYRQDLLRAFFCTYSDRLAFCFCLPVGLSVGAVLQEQDAIDDPLQTTDLLLSKNET